MARLVRVDYQAVNANGVVLFTFNDRDAARAWVRDNACRHDGLCLERIEILATATTARGRRTGAPTPRRLRRAGDAMLIRALAECLRPRSLFLFAVIGAVCACWWL